MKEVNKILWGVIFIALGVIIGLNVLDITDIDLFFDGWWTLFIIVPCFIDLFKDKDKTGNIIGLLIGVALLLACQDVFSFEYVIKLMLPAILVIIGLSFIFKDVINSKVKNEIKKLNKNKVSDHEYCATFGGVDANFDNEEFKGCDLSAIFGGVNCDLTKSKIKDNVVINATAIFGGIDIIVPKGYIVKVSSTSIFGGVGNDYQNTDKENAKIIYVKASCIFGGVSIQ